MTCPPGFIEAPVTPSSASVAVRGLGGIVPAAVPGCVRPSEEGPGLLGAIVGGLQELVPLVFPLLSFPIIAPKSGAQLGAEFLIEETAGAPQGTVSTTASVAKVVLTSGLSLEDTMGLFDDVFTGGGVEDLFGSIDFGSLGQSLITEVGLPLLRQELLPAPQPRALPVSAGPLLPAIRSAVGMTGEVLLGGAITAGALALKDQVKIILQKIAINKGLQRVPALNAVIASARKALPILGHAALAAGLAITAEELATLVFAHATKKRRRMDPGNAKALRRSMRRVESFHKLCQRADMLRSRRRHSGRSKGECGSTRVVSVK